MAISTSDLQSWQSVNPQAEELKIDDVLLRRLGISSVLFSPIFRIDFPEDSLDMP